MPPKTLNPPDLKKNTTFSLSLTVIQTGPVDTLLTKSQPITIPFTLFWCILVPIIQIYIGKKDL